MKSAAARSLPARNGNTPVIKMKPTPPGQEARRENSGWLATIEKRTLLWLAARMPAWVSSDMLTVIGLLSLLGAGLAYWFGGTHPIGLAVVVVFLALNWFGDSLDGTVARVRNAQRPRYGYYVDHIVDCFGALFLLSGMALSGFMHPWIAAGVLIAYLFLSIEVYLTSYALGRFHLSFLRFGPTELRILLAVGNVALYFHPMVRLFGEQYRLFDAGGAVAIVGMTGALLMSVVRHTLELYRAEPLPPRPH